MRFDTIIAGGSIVDGTGEREPFVADIGIQGDRIAAIGDLEKAETAHRISVAGQVVCPGFVDVHVHSEIALLGGRDQFAAVSQGVTDAFSCARWFRMGTLTARAGERIMALHAIRYGDAELPLNWQTPEAYLDMFAGRIPANLCPQVPHCAVRLGVMGWDPRPATSDELLAMSAYNP